VSESLLEVIASIRERLASGAESVTLEILDPDHARGRHAGEVVEIDGERYVHRPWRVWIELADRLGLRMATPKLLTPPRCELRFERLRSSPGAAGSEDIRERYGTASEFARIRKAEEPSFVLDLADALTRVDPAADARILSLGVNAGDELGLMLELQPSLRARASFVGVDHSPSAIARARERFPDPRHRFIEADINTLASLELGRFDLVLALDVLQSPGVDDRELIRRIVQCQLGPRGALILGLPNCRYRDGELIHGARMKNFTQPELSLVIADVAYYRRYLHQHRRKVFVTGTHELLITAVAERGPITR
jgi:trans-aconitate methyltransferase